MTPRKIVQLGAAAIDFPVDTSRERSLRDVFPDIGTLEHLHMKAAITHVLEGIAEVPEAFEITGNPARVAVAT